MTDQCLLVSVDPFSVTVVPPTVSVIRSVLVTSKVLSKKLERKVKTSTDRLQ